MTAAADQLVPVALSEPQVFSEKDLSEKPTGATRTSSHGSSDTHVDIPSQSPLVKVAKSYGVLKSEAAAQWMSKKYIYMIFGFIAVSGYWIGLNQYLEGTYETEALSTSFGQHSLIASVCCQSYLHSLSCCAALSTRSRASFKRVLNRPSQSSVICLVDSSLT